MDRSERKEGASESFFGRKAPEAGLSAGSDALSNTLGRGFTRIQEVCGHERGVCRVYKAQRHGKWLMLKCLKPEYANTAAMRELLHKEFAIGYRLEHPGVMRTYDIEAVDGLGECIVCEWIDGQPLSDIITSGTLTPAQAVAICQDIAEAVDYLHSMQILHLDLKASNIMVTRIGSRAKIIDFGMSDTGDYAVFKTLGGTREYMAPETVPGSDSTDTRADIYALGAIIDRINSSMKRPNRRLRRIAAKCMSPNPADRYNSAAEIKWSARGRSLYALVAVPMVSLAAAVATPLVWHNATTEPKHIVDTLTQVVEVHDTVVVAPPVDTARLAFLSSLEYRIPRIVDEEWEREFTRLIDPTTHTQQEIVANYRPFYEGFGASAIRRVRKLVDSQVPKDDPDYFKIMSGAVAECQQAVTVISASGPRNQRVMDAMLQEE